MSSVRSGWGLVGLGIALALGAVASSQVIAGAITRVKQENQALEVKGFAERRILSDFASWTGGFTTRAAKLTDAYAELSRHRAAVLRFLAEQGVPSDSFELMPVSTVVLFERNDKGMTTNTVEGYALSQRVRVAASDIDLVGALSKSSSALVEQGVEFSSHQPQYLYTGLGELKIAMLGEATEDARERAQVLADRSGGRLGSLLSARQGVFQITPAYSTEISDYGRNDTTSREKSIKAVVTVRYAVMR